MSNRSAFAVAPAALVLFLGAANLLAGFAGTDVFLPMVGRKAGVHPSNWYTTVWLHNPGADAVTAQLSLLERGTSNLLPPWVDVMVAPGDTEKLDNVVETYFHTEVFGALRVTCATKLVVTSRVYSKGVGAGEKDSVGQDFAAVPASFAIGAGEKSRILGVHQTQPSADSDFRYNFGLVETTGHLANVRVTAYDGNGAVQGSTDVTVRAWSQGQWAFKDRFPAVSTESSRLEVEVLTGTGRVIAYGSGIANGSQDPTTFEMTYPDTLLGIGDVRHDATLTGNGTEGAPLGVADAGISPQKLAPAATAGQVLTTIGSGTPAPGEALAASAGSSVAWQSLNSVSLGLTPGGVTFGNVSGGLTQAPSDFFWDEGNRRLGLGTPTPRDQLELTGRLRLPGTAALGGSPIAGVILIGDSWVLHSYGSTDNAFVGPSAGNFTLTAGGSTAVGYASLSGDTTGSNNTGVGSSSLAANTTGNASTAVGAGSLRASTVAGFNSALGYMSLAFNTTGATNTAVGSQSMYLNLTGGNNAALGANALEKNTSGSNNTAVGLWTLHESTIGSANTALGFHAGSDATGSRNVFLGQYAGAAETGSDRLHIANAIGTPLIYGQFDTRRVGINTTAPGQTLSVGGTLGISGGTGFTVFQGSAGQAGDIVYTLPPTNTDGVLHNNAGFLTWDVGTIGGSGTMGQLATWTGSISLGGAAGLFWDGGNGRLGVGTAAPTEQLDLTGSLGLPATTASAGQLKLGGSRFLHAFGTDNTYAGSGSGALTGFADTNSAFGKGTLAADLYGDANTAVGADSLNHNSNLAGNTAVGVRALHSQVHVQCGGQSGQSCWAYNTAVGFEALRQNAPDSGPVFGTTGLRNTAVGVQAGLANVTGSDNTFLGGYADAASANLANATALGNGAVVDASNHVRIGNTAVTQIGGQKGWSNLSDARAKEAIRDLELGLGFVLALRPVQFRMREGDDRTDLGFLAQDIEALLGDGYGVLGIDGDADRTLSLRYTDLIAPLVKAVQEQQMEIAVLRAAVAALQGQLAEPQDSGERLAQP